LFLPTGRTCWYHQGPKDNCHFKVTEQRKCKDPNQPRRCPRGRLRVVTDKLIGVQIKPNGDIANHWKWFNKVVVEEDPLVVIDAELADETVEAELEAAGKTAAKTQSGTPGILKAPEIKTGSTPPPTTTQPATTGTDNRKSKGNALAIAPVVEPMPDQLEDIFELEHLDSEEPKTRLTPAPPCSIVAGKIDRNIGVKITSQEKMTLSFQAENRLVSFNVGSKIAPLTDEGVLESTCKNYKKDIRDFRRKTGDLMTKMKAVIPQVQLQLKLAGKLKG